MLYKKMLTSAKLKGPSYWKVYTLKLDMCVYLRVKFKVSFMYLVMNKIEGP